MAWDPSKSWKFSTKRATIGAVSYEGRTPDNIDIARHQRARMFLNARQAWEREGMDKTLHGIEVYKQFFRAYNEEAVMLGATMSLNALYDRIEGDKAFAFECLSKPDTYVKGIRYL